MKDSIDEGAKTTVPRPNPALGLFLSIKFYWHTATSLCPRHPQQLSGYNGRAEKLGQRLGCRVKHISSLVFYRKSWLSSGPDDAYPRAGKRHTEVQKEQRAWWVVGALGHGTGGLMKRWVRDHHEREMGTPDTPLGEGYLEGKVRVPSPEHFVPNTLQASCHALLQDGACFTEGETEAQFQQL